MKKTLLLIIILCLIILGLQSTYVVKKLSKIVNIMSNDKISIEPYDGNIITGFNFRNFKFKTNNFEIKINEGFLKINPILFFINKKHISLVADHTNIYYEMTENEVNNNIKTLSNISTNININTINIYKKNIKIATTSKSILVFKKTSEYINWNIQTDISLGSNISGRISSQMYINGDNVRTMTLLTFGNGNLNASIKNNLDNDKNIIIQLNYKDHYEKISFDINSFKFSDNSSNINLKNIIYFNTTAKITDCILSYKENKIDIISKSPNSKSTIKFQDDNIVLNSLIEKEGGGNYKSYLKILTIDNWNEGFINLSIDMDESNIIKMDSPYKVNIDNTYFYLLSTGSYKKDNLEIKCLISKDSLNQINHNFSIDNNNLNLLYNGTTYNSNIHSKLSLTINNKTKNEIINNANVEISINGKISNPELSTNIKVDHIHFYNMKILNFRANCLSHGLKMNKLNITSKNIIYKQNNILNNLNIDVLEKSSAANNMIFNINNFEFQTNSSDQFSLSNPSSIQIRDYQGSIDKLLLTSNENYILLKDIIISNKNWGVDLLCKGSLLHYLMPFVSINKNEQLFFHLSTTGIGSYIENINANIKIDNVVLAPNPDSIYNSNTINKAILNINTKENSIIGTLSGDLDSSSNIDANFKIPNFRKTKLLNYKDVLEFQTNGKFNNLNFVSILDKDFRYISGSFKFNLQFKNNSLNSKDINVEDLTIKFDPLNILVKDINVQAYIMDNNLQINGQISKETNPISINGQGNIFKKSYNLNITSKDSIYDYSNIKINYSTNLDIVINDKDVIDINGDLILYNGDINLINQNKFRWMPDEVIIKNRVNNSLVKYKGNIKVSANNIFFSTNDFEATLDGKLNINLLNHSSATFGNIILKNGEYQLYNTKYTINNGYLLYSGQSIDSPELNINASRVLNEIDNEVIGIEATGTIQKPIIKIYSNNNSFVQNNIFSYAVFGTNIGNSSSELASLLALLPSDQLYNIIFSGLRKKSGINFSLESIRKISDDNIDSYEGGTISYNDYMSVVLSKRVNSWLYIKYITNYLSTIQVSTDLNYPINFLMEANLHDYGASLVYSIKY